MGRRHGKGASRDFATLLLITPFTFNTKTAGSDVTGYTWNYNNMLTQVVNGNNTYVYRYDALGNRVARIVNGVETRFVSNLVETGEMVWVI